MTTLRVYIACHNRRAYTVRAIDFLMGQHLDCCIHVVDADSQDGTVAAIRAASPSVEIVLAPRDSFWAQSMAKAQASAVQHCGSRKSVLWLNDDVDLSPQGFAEAMQLHEANPTAIVVGFTVDDAGNKTYGKLWSRHKHPGKLSREPVAPGSRQTFNGNFVLMSSETESAIGPIEAKYVHHYADIDYGYRAQQLGIPILETKLSVGLCPRNPSRPQRLRTLLKPPVGIPMKSHWTFVRNWSGRAAAVHFCSFYAHQILNAAFGKEVEHKENA